VTKTVLGHTADFGPLLGAGYVEALLEPQPYHSLSLCLKLPPHLSIAWKWGYLGGTLRPGGGVPCVDGESVGMFPTVPAWV